MQIFANVPSVPMKRIILHWTAGSYKPNDTDLGAYHFVIDGDGNWHEGVNIAKNSGSLKPGYAAHCLNLNTDSIGVSMACMGGAVENPFNAGKWPMKVEQLHSLIAGVARLAVIYGIPVTPKTILSHAEVQATLGVQQRNKWDYTVLPFDSKVKGAKAIGNYIRDQIQLEIDGQLVAEPLEPWPSHATLRATQNAVAYSDDNLRVETGSVPAGTVVELLDTFNTHSIKVRTPAGYTPWVARASFQLLDGPLVEEATTPNVKRAYITEMRALLDKLEAELK